MRVGTRLDDLGELVVDTAAKEVGANDDLIVRGKAVQNRCGLLGQVLVSVDIESAWTFSRSPESRPMLSTIPDAK